MNSPLRLVLICLTSLLISCDNQGTPVTADAQKFVDKISLLLPGTYSNYAQVHKEQSDRPVTDVHIRQLKTDSGPVFLFESTQRDTDILSQEIYWLKSHPETQQPELHFTYLKEEELSLPLLDVLELAWARVKPGCVIAITQIDQTINGTTNPETCLFDHLLQGETKLERRFALTGEALTIENNLMVPGVETSPEDKLNLQKHRVFEGWASSRPPTDPEQTEHGEWKLSTILNIRDDGRINHVRNQQMESIGFGLQLAKLKRRDNEPPYMLLSIINMEVGGIQAYTWFDPGTDTLELNLDWFQTHLQLRLPATPDKPE